MNEVVATIIIAASKDARALRAIQSLCAQTIPREHYELILVENGSCDLQNATPEGVVYCHLPHRNMPAARNLGLRSARGKFVLFTDADCVADRGWIAAMVSALEEQRHAAVGGRIERFEPRTVTQRLGSNIVEGQRRLSYLPALHLPYVAGANVAFRRSALVEVGGFDEDLLSGNDVDVCYKIGLKGSTIGLAPDAVVYHDNRTTIAAHFRRFVTYAIYQVLLFKKYKAISRKLFVFNTYPWRLVLGSLPMIPVGLALAVLGRPGLLLHSFLRMVEAAGVLTGDIVGSIRYREVYL